MLMGCDSLKMDYIPTPDQIHEHFSSFLIDPIKIEGVYGNYDVDSVLFTYTSKNNEPIKELSKSLVSKQWIMHKSSRTEAILYKTEKGLEVVKAGKGRSNLCIAWLQADGANSINAQTSETKWAKKHFWPKYEKCKNT